jgi:hypothetical protein
MTPAPSSHDDLLKALGDLAETLEHVATSARHQVETRHEQPNLSATELRLLSRLLRAPHTTIRAMAHPSFPTSSMLRAAESLQRKHLISAQAPPPHDEDTAYVATRAANEFRAAVRDYRTRCFRYALTAVPDSVRRALEDAAPALEALAAALGYRDVHQEENGTTTNT